MIKFTKVNNITVKPIKTKTENKPVLGGEILGDSPYVNIMMVAPTHGGKTTTMYTILKHCMKPKKSIIVAFVPSIYNDENWIAIRDYLVSKGNTVIVHTSLKDENKVDILTEYIKSLSKMAEEKDYQRQLEKDKLALPLKKDGKSNIYFPNDEETIERKPKHLYAKFIFIFDDISEELKLKCYESLMKKARHYEILTITSTQDAKDITPATIKQMRIWLLFKGIGDERLQHIYQKLGLKISFDDFKSLYEVATKDVFDNEKKQWKRYNFLYFRPRDYEFRRNFDEKITV